MRAGLLLSGNRPAREAVSLAVQAEAVGVDEIWVSEDYCERGAFALAAAVAQATSRVRVGLGVINAWTRHPMLVAMEFAALDEIAEQRAVLGIGASNQYWMQHELGIPFQQPLERMRECVDLLRPLLAGKRVDHDGSRWQVHAQLSFRPDRVAPPIVLGVKGPRAMRLAGEVADGVLLSLLAGPAYVAWARETLGADADVSAYVAFSCDTDASVARDRLRGQVAKYIGVHGVHRITEAAGIAPSVAMACREGWQQGMPRADLVDDEILDAVAVAGNPRDCRSSLRGLAEAGLNGAVLTDRLTRNELAEAVEAIHDG
jgi:5,10-methylenetetrahydromethanopterin reductase